MKYFIFFTALFQLSLSAWSQDLATRAVQSYLDTDQDFDLDCYYSWNQGYKLLVPVNETKKDADRLTRDFRIEGLDQQASLKFTVAKVKDSVVYEAVFDETHISRGRILRSRQFYIAPIKDKGYQAKFETNKIYCAVNIADAPPYVLYDGDYHFSVHPQKNYDWQSRLQEPVEKYLNDNRFNSVIFLETTNTRGNQVDLKDFLAGKPYVLTPYKFESDLVNVPEYTPLVVSPAGNNRFELQARKQISITFTGGNHNYCIWNVARHVIEALLNGKSTARISLNYDMNAIVAQIGGMEGMKINFLRKDVNQNNMLSHLLRDPATQQTYHSNYLQYFVDYLAREYKAMYKSYTVNYSAPGFSKTVVLQGQGERDLVVDFSYF